MERPRRRCHLVQEGCNKLNRWNIFSTLSRSWNTARIPLLMWFGVTTAALTFAPNGWHALLTTCGTYYDAGNYTRLAADGYGNADGMTAFYPLWPFLIRILSGHSLDIQFLGIVGAITAAIFFLLSIHLVISWLHEHLITRFENLGVMLLVLSPLSVFRVLAFTESLFSLLVVLLVIELSSKRRQLLWTALWAMLLAITRPLFPILMIAALISSILIFLIRSSLPDDDARILQKKLVTIFLCAPVGYSPFGFFCYQRFGNFWQPFSAQKYWDRSFGFHWDIIIAPKVINGSNEVLVWDLIAFYGPFLLLGFLLWRILPFKNAQASAPAIIGVLFGLLIACAHSALAFLTHDRFMSLSRHVLANPLLYLGLIVSLSFCRPEKEPIIRRTLIFLIVTSCVFLGMWWFRFSRDQWIG